MKALKPSYVRAIIVSITLVVAGFWFKSYSAQITPQILTKSPFAFEKNNPVPEIKQWNENGKTYYYFNWGVKPSAGYSLSVDKVKRNIIKLKALTPEPGVLVAQLLTYPSLFISLPEDDYKVEVVDREGNVLHNFFSPKNKSLKMTIFLPHGKALAKREVLREAENKPTAQLALEALFSQEEIMDFVNVGVNVIGASLSDNKWFVLITKSFDNLTENNKKLMTDIISKTVLTLKTENVTAVVITTNPEEMPG